MCEEAASASATSLICSPRVFRQRTSSSSSRILSAKTLLRACASRVGGWIIRYWPHSPGPSVWVDAQIAPALALWLRDELGIEEVALRDLGLRDAEDREIFERARGAGAFVLSEDSDFVDLVARFGPPPQIVWLRCGNTTNAHLRTLFTMMWPRVAGLLAANEPLVEIGGSD